MEINGYQSVLRRDHKNILMRTIDTDRDIKHPITPHTYAKQCQT